MWDVLKTAVTGIKDALGIELPEIPADLGGLTDLGNVTDLGESLPDVTAATDAATTGLTDVTEAASTGLTDVTEVATANLPVEP